MSIGFDRYACSNSIFVNRKEIIIIMDKVKEILQKIIPTLIIVGLSLGLVGVFTLTDGYEPTPFGWCVLLIALACLVIAVFALVWLLVIKLKEEHGIKGVVIFAVVLVLVVAMLVFFLMGFANGEGDRSYSSGYECFNCGGDGWDSANGCSCVWCGGDGRTSWNP